jgi:hypothetical protein
MPPFDRLRAPHSLGGRHIRSEGATASLRAPSRAELIESRNPPPFDKLRAQRSTGSYDAMGRPVVAIQAMPGPETASSRSSGVT